MSKTKNEEVSIIENRCISEIENNLKRLNNVDFYKDPEDFLFLIIRLQGYAFQLNLLRENYEE